MPEFDSAPIGLLELSFLRFLLHFVGVFVKRKQMEKKEVRRIGARVWKERDELSPIQFGAFNTGPCLGSIWDF
ncbi:hypothetical protein TorRG33x02_309530 [Trema orientale]|uniref:Uncharacterized protein n=1 Tax=Trema orientale TaxID=63057 RepID=A0A2P5BTI0_TREOI|nr:hypothetical protein TorRG33x02_309530 [Trema orientale]